MPRNKKTVFEDEVIEEVKQEEETKQEEDVKETPVVVKKTKKEYSDHDYIPCHSVTAGGLHISCKSGNEYTFVEYGAVGEIEYRDLIDLIRMHTSHIFLPRIIIDDKDFLEDYKQIKQIYEQMYNTGDLKDILLLPADQIRGVIDQLPDGLIPTLRSLAATMIADGEIDSVKTVKVLSNIFGADFDLLSELSLSK